MESIESKERKIPDLLYRVAIGTLIFFVALLVGISAAHAPARQRPTNIPA